MTISSGADIIYLVRTRKFVTNSRTCIYYTNRLNVVGKGLELLLHMLRILTAGPAQGYLSPPPPAINFQK
jgi:hypothetical protein